MIDIINEEQENILMNYDKKNIPISLKIICGLTGVFFFIELIIGIYTKSLALQADALHMASDFISLLVAIYSQKVVNCKPNKIYIFKNICSTMFMRLNKSLIR